MMEGGYSVWSFSSDYIKLNVKNISSPISKIKLSLTHLTIWEINWVVDVYFMRDGNNTASFWIARTFTGNLYPWAWRWHSFSISGSSKNLASFFSKVHSGESLGKLSSPSRMKSRTYRKRSPSLSMKYLPLLSCKKGLVLSKILASLDWGYFPIVFAEVVYFLPPTLRSIIPDSSCFEEACEDKVYAAYDGCVLSCLSYI